MISISTESVSRRLTGIILGADQSYRQNQAGAGGVLDTEGLVPVHWAKGQFPDIELSEAIKQLQCCLDEAATLPDPWARGWLSDMASSFRILLSWLTGEDLSYEQVVAGCLQVDPRPPSQARINQLVTARDQALIAAGLAPERKGYEIYLERDGVAPEDVGTTLQELLGEGRTRTLARLPILHVPTEPIGVKAVNNVPFTAYCDYPGRVVWINTDVPHTRSGLKHLVGHEAYPGHYVHMGHRDTLVKAGKMLPDGALVVTNTASSVLFEGIAERGLDFLGWRNTPFDAIAWAQNNLEKACTLTIAHGLNTGRMNAKEATALLDQLCYGDPVWIEGRIRFVTHQLRAPFIYAYWWGGAIVGAWWAGVKATDFNKAISYLYDRMHSPATLTAYWPLTEAELLEEKHEA